MPLPRHLPPPTRFGTVTTAQPSARPPVGSAVAVSPAPPPTRYGLVATPSALQPKPAASPSVRVPAPPVVWGHALPPAGGAPKAGAAQPKLAAVPPAHPVPPAPGYAGVVQPMMSKLSRPSREERDRERFKKNTVSKVDKSLRTRAGKKAETMLIESEEKTPEEIIRAIELDIERNRAPRKVKFGVKWKDVYSGKWRGFEESFAAEWWGEQSTPWVCWLCKTAIDPDGKGDAQPTIEHKKAWASIKTEIRTHIVCKDGIHWEVVLTDRVRAVLQDESNLAPAHKGCNSVKNGPKNTDSIAPKRVGVCAGGCSYREAK